MSAASGASAAAATRLRRRIVEMAATPEGCHLGGSMSIVEIMVALYTRILAVGADGASATNDCCILSKGHAAAALYAALVERGLLGEHELAGYGQRGSRLAGHPLRGLPGVAFPTGSLGHGLSLGLGLALALRMDGDPGRVFVVLGDGELQEGAVWEAAAAAARLRVERLVAIVDHNGLQINGRVPPGNLAQCWSAFGWTVAEVDGHDIEALTAALTALPVAGTPCAVVARTIKGKGIAPFENRVKSHYMKLTSAQAAGLVS